jgi:uncharacterized protein YqgC (DUF456 family)
MKILGRQIKVSEGKEHFFNIFKKVLGVVAIVVGIISWLFPFLPGWLFIFVGLELLGIHILFVDNIKKYLKSKLIKKKKV